MTGIIGQNNCRVFEPFSRAVFESLLRLGWAFSAARFLAFLAFLA